MRPLRVLVVDDEAPARRAVRLLVEREEGLEVAGEASTGDEAATALRELDPDVVFLDVRMPGPDGMEILRRIRSGSPSDRPAVVLASAHGEHGVEAFEHRALDYLLKPFSDRRFHACAERIREHFGGGVAAPPRDTFAIRRGSRLVLVDVEDVLWIAADGDYAVLHTRADGEHLLRATMRELERRLAPRGFIRVHRSTLVRADFIREVRSVGAGRDVVLGDGTRRSLSPAGQARLEEALGVRL
ncbi:MAG TPA: LytTR family DNA-binding domain-containing protein [Longimicrobiales bacterium]|nr:LytTR family DNA-binding domain-containing protein [Longimicrobiales bacterium]